MPFDYDKYQDKCNGMTTDELQKEWENYTRQMSSGATSTATSILFMPITGGFSAVGIGLSAPRIHNARKKREIIEAGLKARGTTHHTRTGDVLAPMAVSGIIGGLTLGFVPPGADSVAGVAAGRGLEIAAANTAMNATESIVVDKARKKAEHNTNIQSQAQTERYGTMATPFLNEESILAFQEQNLVQQQVFKQQYVQQQFFQQQVIQQPVQPFTTTNGNEGTESVNQVSNSQAGVTDAYAARILQDDQIQTPAATQPQTAHVRAQLTSSEATVSDSIPSHKLDLTDLLDVDEDHMLALHALTVAMEKLETKRHISGRAPGESGPQPTNQEHIEQIKPLQSFTQSGPQALRSIDEIQVRLDDSASPYMSYQPQKQQSTPLSPQASRSSTLPDRVYSPQTGQDTQYPYYPPQALPAYQPHYFSSPQQVAEPQQYNTPPLPPQGFSAPPQQQRQDSGYGSMHSTPSISSVSSQTYYPPRPTGSVSPQTYYPSPSQFASRHSSIPQSYAPPLQMYEPPYQQRQGSDVSFYPMTPPPPYYQQQSPDINASPAKQNDYFNQNAVPPPPMEANQSKPHLNPLLAQPQKLVDEINKGWQWARSAAALSGKTSVDSKKVAEPNYGIPPPVPTSWRGS